MLSSQTEWNHFASLNYLIPPTTPVRDLDHIDFPLKDHAATLPIMQGVLERKKRFVRNWKEGESSFALGRARHTLEHCGVAATLPTMAYLTVSVQTY